MPNSTRFAASMADIQEASARLAGLAHRTPVLTSETINQLAGREVFFKCENLQKTGSFKYRGATNAVQKLTPEQASRGVVTHSSGNHAQALALAAKVRGIPAHVVMPRTAPAVKQAAVRGYGANVVLCEPTLADRERTAQEIVTQTGGVLIPPFDHPDVIAGQGTVAFELLNDVPQLDSFIVPVGGGGLISGCAIAGRAIKPTLRVFGAEPALAGDAALSKQQGQRQPAFPPQSIADGLLTSLGELTWPIVRDLVERIFTVSEDEIRRWMRFVWERMKLVIEPSAAVGVAVLMSEEFRQMPSIHRVGVVLCGGNVNLDQLYW